MTNRARSLVLLALALGAGQARADGSAQTGTNQGLRAGAVMYVDIFAPATEKISWTGTGTVAITAPGGGSLGSLASGQTLTLTGQTAGAYRVVVGSTQSTGSSWDLGVTDATDALGRVFSYNWTFDAGSFAQSAATYGSFYAIVDGGTASHRPVIELKLNGLAGYVYDINANEVGIDGSQRGKSVPMNGNSVTPEYPIYLRPPSVATYSHGDASAFGLAYVGGTSIDVNGQPITPCNLIAAGQSEGLFQFTATTTGSYHLQCDLDGDGVMSATDPDDLLIIGDTQVGLNLVSWNGRVNGVAIATGTYNCGVQAMVGEFHYVGRDIETSYLGMRMYDLASDGTRTPLRMFWDDTLVQANAITMPNGNLGLVSPGTDGMLASAYAATPQPDVDARAWGRFIGAGKGDNAYLDTYTYLTSATSTSISVTAIDPLLDTDGDGASNFVEQCTLGTDPADADSDDDGTTDGVEYWNGNTPASTGGLESNGRLATAIATRAVRLHLGVAARATAHVGPLATWLDGVALDGLTAQPSTPTELPAVTNARDVYGVDLIDAGGTRQAALLLIGTTGELYEHSKEICDRAHGAEMDQVSELMIDGVPMVMSRFRRPDGSRDHAIALKLFDDPAGARLEGGWLGESFSTPNAEQPVINVQLWAGEPARLERLARALIAAWRASGRVVTTSGPVPEGGVLGRPTPTAPRAFLRGGDLLGEDLGFTIRERMSDGPLRLRLVGADEAGVEHALDLGAVTTAALTAATARLPLFRDITLELRDDHGVLDRMWLSDGAWARFDDGLWGGATTAIVDTACAATHHDGLATTASRLAGCAATRAEQVDQVVGVARHLARPRPLRAHRYLLARVDASRAGEVCVESTARSARACAAFPAGDRWMAWPTDGFTAEAADATELITFAVGAGGAASVRVTGLALVDEAPSDATVPSPRRTERAGCDAGGGAAGPSVLIVMLTFLVRRRPRAS